uniref:Patched domain-containing protein 3 n=1 Tax=Toxocara canis TaxID=6265 RepID=A0A183VBW7_TOXCA
LQGLSAHQDRETFISKIFREVYGPFLLTESTKKAVLFIYLIYISFAILGCSMVEEGLNPKFLVRESFYLNKFYVLMDETFWREGLQMQVVVNSPPDFFNHFDRKKFQAMLDEFENTEFTMKHNATMLWLDAYERKLDEESKQLKIPLPKTNEEWYERCREWLITAGGRRLWEKDVVWGKNSSDPETYNHLYAFRFQLGLRNYRTPTDHVRSAQLMRAIAAKYSQFNVTTFHEYYPFVDQYIELKPALIRNCILALISMLIVSFIMIPNYGAAFAIAGAICSIDVGVVGYMTFWGVRLESVSMITVIMSIGFAVDLSAHIGYAYVKAHGDRKKKAIEALETIGWPVFLGAFSTVVGILVLVTVDAYIVQIFFKTIFLVIVFSMMHGLIFLPVLLTFVLPHAKDRDAEHEIPETVCKKDDSANRQPIKDKEELECARIDESSLAEIDLSDPVEKEQHTDSRVMDAGEAESKPVEETESNQKAINNNSFDDEIQSAENVSATKDGNLEESGQEHLKRSQGKNDAVNILPTEPGLRLLHSKIEKHESRAEMCSETENKKRDDFSHRRKSQPSEQDKRKMLEVESFQEAERLAAISDNKSGVSV